MAGGFKDVKAVGRYVVLKFVPVKRELYEKKEGSTLLLPTGGSEGSEKTVHKAIIHGIGPEVEKPNFDIGDEVVFNQYDLKQVENDNGDTFGIVQGTSIMAVLEV